jgi:hypothetical protein
MVKAVDTLVGKINRDAHAGFFHKPFLDGVDGRRVLAEGVGILCWRIICMRGKVV